MVKQKGVFSSFIIRLSIVATALSVMVMIVSVAIITGFSHNIKDQLYSFWGHVTISVRDENFSLQKPIQKDPELEQHVKNIPHVQTIQPFIEGTAIIHAHNAMQGIILKGVDAHFHHPGSIHIKGKIDFSDSAYSKQIIISQTNADKLELSTGDTVQLYFIEKGVTTPRIRKVMISGVFETGSDDIDGKFGICDMRLLQRINSWEPNEIHGYQVMLDDPKYADTVSNEIFYNYIKTPLNSYTLREKAGGMFSWLDTVQVNNTIILIIMAIVAIINLTAALMILIVDHAKMVGLLKALGLADIKMREVFLYYASLIAGIGITVGNVLGLGLCYIQYKTGFVPLGEGYNMKTVPIRLYWWQIVAIDGGTLVICILFMWLPTLYIRRIQPAKVLQFK